MKKVVFMCLLITSFTGKILAQKQDAIWLLSTNSINIGDKCGIDFNVIPADTFIDYRRLGFIITNASICDSNGSILLYPSWRKRPLVPVICKRPLTKHNNPTK